MTRVLATYESDFIEPLTKGVKLNPDEQIFLLVDVAPPSELIQAIANRCSRLVVLIPKIKRGFWMCACWPSSLETFLRQRASKTMRFEAIPITTLQAEQHLGEIDETY